MQIVSVTEIVIHHIWIIALEDRITFSFFQSWHYFKYSILYWPWHILQLWNSSAGQFLLVPVANNVFPYLVPELQVAITYCLQESVRVSMDVHISSNENQSETILSDGYQNITEERTYVLRM